MNSNVCVVTIIFLSLENVAGLICSPFGSNKPSQHQQPSMEKPEEKCDLKGTQDFICNSQKLCHELHQGYQDRNLQIATVNIPPQKWGKRIGFTIKVEEFDNNTEIYCENSKEKTERPVQDPQIVNAKLNSNLDFDSNSEPYLIKIEANETCEYGAVQILRENNEEPTILYSKENQNVSFSCPEPSNTTYILLGIINTTSNKLKTFDSTHKILNITRIGTILCCVYYVVNETAEEMWITRVVANKTLVLHYYNDTVWRGSLEGEVIIRNTTTNNSTGTDSAAFRDHETIIITIAVTVAFIFLVIIVTCKKLCRKTPQSDAKVLYADLDILRQIQPDSLPRPGPAEESPYAQIIGEMRPQTE